MTDSFESDSSSRSRAYSSDSRYSTPTRGTPTRGSPTTRPSGLGGSRRDQARPTTGNDASRSVHATTSATALDASNAAPYPVQVPPDQVAPQFYERPPTKQRDGRRDLSASGSDDESTGGRFGRGRLGQRPLAPPDGSVVRIIKPEDFKTLFHGSIAQSHTYEPPPHGRSGEPHRGDPRKAHAPAAPSLSHSKAGGAAAPRPNSSSRQSRPATRDFIDPYRGTTYRHRIVIPPPSQPTNDGGHNQEANRKRRAASKLREQVHQAQAITANSAVPPKTPSYKELGAYQELQEAKQVMLKKDKELDMLRRELRRLEEHSVRLENSTLKGKPGDVAAQLQQTLDNLRSKTSLQAQRVVDLEEQLYDIKQRSRASRVGELEHQCAAYISENRRLSAILSEMNEISKKGGEAALLQEAQHLLRQKDSALDNASEKLRVARDELRRAEAEAQTWRTRWDSDHKDTEEVRRRLEELKEAPAEILRLRRELEALHNDRVDNVHREERSRAGAAYEHTHAKHHVEALTRERDQLLNQLREKERIAEGHRLDASKRNAVLEQEMQSRMSAQLVDERRQHQDREHQLKQLVGDWERKCKTLQEQNLRLQEKGQQDQENLRIKDQHRQESILATMGKFEKDRMVEMQRNMEDREMQLKKQQDELTAERARWEAERTTAFHRLDDTSPPGVGGKHPSSSVSGSLALQQQQGSFRQQQQSQPAAPPPPLAAPAVAPMYPVPSSAGPTHAREASSTSIGGGGRGGGPSDSLQGPLSPQRHPSNAAVPIVSMSQRHEAATPIVVSQKQPANPIGSAPTKAVPRYDRGEDAPSEVTVRHGQDDASSVTSSLASDSHQSGSPTRLNTTGGSAAPAATPTAVAAAASGAKSAAVPPSGIVPKLVAPPPPSPTVRLSTTGATGPMPLPANGTSPPPPTALGTKVPVVVPVPSAASTSPVPAQSPGLSSPAAGGSATAAPPPPAALPLPAPVSPQGSSAAGSPGPIAPPPVAVPVVSPTATPPNAASTSPPKPVVVPVPVVAPPPPPAAAAAHASKAPPPVSVLPVGTATKLGPTSPNVPAPAAVSVGVPMSAPSAVPVPTALVPSHPSKPAVGGVAPTKRPPPVTSDDSDDEEFVINDGPSTTPGGKDEEDDF